MSKFCLCIYNKNYVEKVGHACRMKLMVMVNIMQDVI